MLLPYFNASVSVWSFVICCQWVVQPCRKVVSIQCLCSWIKRSFIQPWRAVEDCDCWKRVMMASYLNFLKLLVLMHAKLWFVFVSVWRDQFRPWLRPWMWARQDLLPRYLLCNSKKGCQQSHWPSTKSQSTSEVQLPDGTKWRVSGVQGRWWRKSWKCQQLAEAVNG